MTVKCSETQGLRREAKSERSVEQICDLTNRNRIQGSRTRTSGQLIAKSRVIKGYGCKSGECAEKVTELTPGDLQGCLGDKTRDVERHFGNRAEVSRERSSSARDQQAPSKVGSVVRYEGSNGARKGLMEKASRT